MSDQTQPTESDPRRIRVATAIRLIAAAVTACHLAVPTGGAGAQDTELQIRQVPKEKQFQEDARDAQFESDSAPEHCSDPEVAASDPACAKSRSESGNFGGLPAVQDAADDQMDLLPGVTINQSRGSGR